MLCIAQEGVFNVSHYTKYHVMVWKNTVKFPSLSVSLFLAEIHCCVRLYRKIQLIGILLKENKLSLQLCHSASGRIPLTFLPMVFFCLWPFAMVKANRIFALIFLGSRKLQNLEALGIVQCKKEMQGSNAFHLDESLHRLKRVILMSVASVYGIVMFIKDAVYLGKSVQGPPKHPRALTPEAGQQITLSTCSVSFPLAGSSSCTGAGAGLTTYPGACQAQLEPVSPLSLSGALLFYEW